MASGGVGLSLNAWAIQYRRLRNLGSPTLPVLAPNTQSHRLWQYWFFGHGAATRQGQTSAAEGQQTGIAGIANSGQGQTVTASGTVAPLVHPHAYGRGTSLVTNAWLIRFRQQRPVGIPTIPFIGNADLAFNRVWQTWLWGHGAATRQGQTSAAAGSQLGQAGPLSTTQSQTISASGSVAELIRPWSFGKGLTPVTSGLSINYRKQRPLGSPTVRFDGAWRVWQAWLWGHGATTSQILGVDGLGTVSGAAGALVIGQASSSVFSEGEVSGAAGFLETGQASPAVDAAGVNIPAMGYLVFGGDRTSNLTTRAYVDGSAQWTADHGDTIFCVATDSSGNVYTGGWRTGNYTTRKYNSSGSLQWSQDHGQSVYAIAVDASGNVYTGGAVSSSVTTRKYNSAGTEQWTANHGATVFGIAVDSSGNVFTGGERISSVTTRKYNSSGTEQSTMDFGDTVYSIALDSSGNLYMGGNRQGTKVIAKYDSSYTQQWTGDGFPKGNGIAVDSNGNVYACGDGTIFGAALRKWNSSGSVQWSVNPSFGGEMRAVCIDQYNHVYVCGERYSNTTIWKYNSSAGLLWTGDHGAMLYGIAWGVLPLSTDIPALSFNIGLGLPFPTTIITIPSLSLSISLAIPTSSEFDPPDISGLAIQQIYRAYLTGIGDSLYEIPLASIQCRRRLNESTWLFIQCPNYSNALYQNIVAYIDQELLIYSGIRHADLSEEMGIFLRATLTEVEYERGQYGGSLQLTARVINPSYSTRRRTLTGVNQYSRIAGKRTYQCDVDPLLRPNDTITGLGSDFSVLSIEYKITPYSARMIVTENV